MTPTFGVAVRWALFAEKLGANIGELRAAAKRTPPPGTTGRDMIEFTAALRTNRRILARIDEALYPEDGREASDG